MQPAVALDLTEERVVRDLQRLKALPHVFVGFPGKATACLPHRDKALLVVVESEHQGAEVLARAAGIGVAADDALLALYDFDLQPLARSLRQITTAAPLGDDAFQAT